MNMTSLTYDAEILAIRRNSDDSRTFKAEIGICMFALAQNGSFGTNSGQGSCDVDPQRTRSFGGCYL